VGDYEGDVYCDKGKCYIWVNDVSGARWVPYDRELMHKIINNAKEKKLYRAKCQQWNAVMDTLKIVGFAWSFGTGSTVAPTTKVVGATGLLGGMSNVCKQ
jgi:hypothetical protein